jgi:hypothetical protein
MTSITTVTVREGGTFLLGKTSLHNNKDSDSLQTSLPFSSSLSSFINFRLLFLQFSLVTINRETPTPEHMGREMGRETGRETGREMASQEAGHIINLTVHIAIIVIIGRQLVFQVVLTSIGLPQRKTSRINHRPKCSVTKRLVVDIELFVIGI